MGLTMSSTVCLNTKKVKAISFVGSQAVAEYVYKRAQSMANVSKKTCRSKKSLHCPQRCRFRCGNKQIIGAAFGSAGEQRMAAAVVAVEEDVADELIQN
ncbi:aldehyde dehydrogenase family protein [Bacillus sp. SL00103]